MNKLKTTALLMLSLLLCFFACQKLELVDEENKGGNGNTEQPPTDKNEGTEKPPKDDGNGSTKLDTLGIMEALSLPKKNLETDVILKGYIVGYIKGVGLNSASFSLPDKGPNTNMLLADSPQETLAANCLPVALSKSGSFAIREKLNLYDHPEFMHKSIAIYGIITTYFNINGIKSVWEYSFLDDSAPETPHDTINNWPGIDNNPQIIPGGR